MANPITVPLPADLPTSWVNNDIISPDGTSVGLSAKHGYNYLMTQVNNAQNAAKQLGEAFDDRTTIIGSLPVQTGSVVFNGSAQSPAWANYDPSKLTLGGTTSATNPGTYNATFAPVQGYTWADGTTATKTVTWTMAEEALTVPVVTQPLVFNGQEQSPSFSNYDPSKLTLSLTAQSAVGSYNASFTPKTGYKWADGTTLFKNVAWSIVAKKVAVPTQAGTVVYNGQAQRPIFANYDPDELTLGGVTSGTDAGSYTATFTPKAGYTWSDGTTTAQNVTWTITALPQKSFAVTLAAASWVNGAQTVNVTGMTATSNGVFGIASSATSEQLTAYGKAQILVTGQAAGTITVTAYGTAPEVDIPCTFIFVV